MWNDWLTIGPVTIHGYGAMIAIGVLAAIWFSEKQAKKHNLNPSVIEPIAIVGLVVGYAFSKLTYCITVWDQFLKNPASVLGSGGWVVYGGILGGILGAYIYCRIKKVDFIRYFNLCIPSVSLAQAFGRIGCFFAGCCYGKVTHGAFGITFPTNSLCTVGEPVIPTQLLSALGDFLLFLILYRFYENEKLRSKTASVYLMGYSAGRFLLEFLRGDIERGSVGILSTSQFIAIFVFLAGIALYFVSGKKKESTIQ